MRLVFAPAGKADLREIAAYIARTIQIVRRPLSQS